MPRIYTYRGKTAEELAALSTQEFSKIVNSRQRRAIKRIGLLYKKLAAEVEKSKKSNPKKVIKTHVREAVILPSWLNLKFGVYDGKTFQEIVITPEMLGHRLGEFVYTTHRVMHSAPGIRATRGSKFLAVK